MWFNWIQDDYACCVDTDIAIHGLHHLPQVHQHDLGHLGTFLCSGFAAGQRIREKCLTNVHTFEVIGVESICISFACSSESGLAFEAVLNALPSVDSFFLMGGTLTAYIVFRELEKAGSSSSRSVGDYYPTFTLSIIQASHNHHPVLRSPLPAPHDPLRPRLGRHCCRPAPPCLWPTVVTLCRRFRGALYSLLEIKNASQGMQDNGLAKLTLCERSHR